MLFIILYLSLQLLKFNLKTPGREKREPILEGGGSDVVISNTTTDELISSIVLAVGGKENIDKVDACFTRLRLTLVDLDKVEEDVYFKDVLGANGVVRVQNGVQIIYGNKAALYKTEMREYLGLE